MIQQLIKLGFSEGEAKVYTATLELGETSAARIAGKAKIERTTVYGFIESLKKRGYLTVSMRGKKTVYSANNPKRLKSEQEEKSKLIESVLPELLSITNAIDSKPTVRYFDSKEGIFDVYRETLEYPNTPMRGWLSSAWYDAEKFWTEYYLPTRIEKKIPFYGIVPETEEMTDFVKDDQKSLRQTRMVKGSPITADVMLYGKRSIAVMSYKESTALVIESTDLFQTLSFIFNEHWKALSKK
jgi:sugar-specific transcriptional regulator TrmB